MSVEIISELKNGCDVYYYPGASTAGGRDGIIVFFESNPGIKWQGIFAFGDVSKNGVTGVFNLSGSDKYYVISRGAGYVVSLNNPLDCEEIDSIPILDVRVLDDLQIIIFADYTGLVVYNSEGIAWRNDHLVHDGFKIIGIENSILTGECLDTNTIFQVDLSMFKV